MLAVPLAAAQDASTAPTFEIRRFTVAGNTVLAEAKIDEALAPFVGARRSFADIEAAVAALQATYAGAGYGAVKVVLPEQQVASGDVRIDVVEARLRALTVAGNAHFDAGNIRRSLPSLRPQTTPNTDALAREIRLANENPAKRVSVDLKSDSPGEIDAVVSVQDDKPWKIGVVLDNTGTPATGQTRIGAFLQHANVAGFDHVATLQYVTSPDRTGEVTIAALNYRIPLPMLGDSLDVFAVHADVDSGVVGDLFTVRGRGTVAGIRYTRNLPATARYQHRSVYGLEHRAFDNRIGVVGSSPDLVPDVTVHPASVGYAASWNGAGQQLDFSATYFRNIPGGSHGSAADIAAARAGAKAEYSLLRYAATYVQRLPADWRWRLAGEGQYSRDALVSGEQFGIGGQHSVRGFFEREIVNDTGNRLTLELETPDFGDRLGTDLVARALVFVDHGWVRRNKPLPGELTRAHVSSVGAGLRVSVAPSWQARVDVAHVIRGAGVRARGAERLHFSLGFAY